MKTRSLAVLAFALGALAVPVVRAQEPEDPEALVKALADPDFAAREKAYARLKEIGAGAREALEKGAKSGDAQVRWAAERLLRGLGDPARPARVRVLRFGEEDGEEVAIPARADLDRALDEMHRRLEEMEREFEALPRRTFRFDLQPGAGGARVERHAVRESDGRRTEVRVDAEGRVTVKLREGADAKEETVEADSVEALQKDHPAVHEKVKDLLGEDRPRVRVLRMPSLRAAAPRPALGVGVSEVPEVLRAHCALPADAGLVVDEVLPETPAARLGVRRHDVLLAVNGIPVSSAEDVRSALAAVEEGGALRLRILRGGKSEDLSGTR